MTGSCHRNARDEAASETFLLDLATKEKHVSLHRSRDTHSPRSGNNRCIKRIVTRTRAMQSSAIAIYFPAIKHGTLQLELKRAGCYSPTCLGTKVDPEKRWVQCSRNWNCSPKSQCPSSTLNIHREASSSEDFDDLAWM